MTEETMKKRPEFIAYAVREFTKKDGEIDASWTKVGIAWTHKDGDGMNIVLEALPVNGKVTLRKAKAK